MMLPGDNTAGRWMGWSWRRMVSECDFDRAVTCFYKTLFMYSILYESLYNLSGGSRFMTDES